jgi:hypothetical protein
MVFIGISLSHQVIMTIIGNDGVKSRIHGRGDEKLKDDSCSCLCYKFHITKDGILLSLRLQKYLVHLS